MLRNSLAALLMVAFVAAVSACDQRSAEEQVIEHARSFESRYQYDRAIRLYSDELKKAPDNTTFLYLRAYDYLSSDQFDSALEDCEVLLKADPPHPMGYLIKGLVLDVLGFEDTPIKLYKKGLKKAPEPMRAQDYLVLGRAWQKAGKENKGRALLIEGIKKIVYPELPRDYGIKGATLRSLKQNEEARNVFVDGVKRFPDCAELHIMLASLLGEQGYLYDCIDHAEQALRINGDLKAAYSLLGSAYLYTGRFKKSIKCLNPLIKDQPNWLTCLFARGDSLSSLGKYQLARKDFLQALSYEPNHSWATIKLSTTYDAEGEREKAIHMITDAIEKSPKKFRLYLQRGDLYAKDKNFDAAFEDLNRVLSLDPRFAEAHYQKAKLRNGMGKLDEALKDLEKAIKLSPDSGLYYALRGEIHLKQKQIEKARTDLKVATKKGAQDAYTYSILAQCNLYTQRYKEALVNTMKGIKNDPKFKICYLFRAVANGMLGKDNEEVSDFNHYLNLSRYKDRAFYEKGCLYSELGNSSKAITDLSRALKVNPGVPDFYAARAVAYLKAGKMEECIKDASTAIKLNPKNAEPYVTRGAAFRSIDKLDNSIKDLSLAINLAPKFGRAYFERAQTFSRQQRLRDANRDVNKASSLGYEPTSSGGY